MALIKGPYELHPLPVRGVPQVLVSEVLLHPLQQRSQIGAVFPPVIHAVIMLSALCALALRIQGAVPVKKDVDGKDCLPLPALSHGLAHQLAPALRVSALDILEAYLVLPAQRLRLLGHCLGQPHGLPDGRHVEILVAFKLRVIRKAPLPRLRGVLFLLAVQDDIFLLRLSALHAFSRALYVLHSLCGILPPGTCGQSSLMHPHSSLCPLSAAYLLLL